MSHAPESPSAPSVCATLEIESPAGALAPAVGSAIKTYELAALLRAAKVLDTEAQTWCEGFAVKRDALWVWSKEYEWAQLRAMHCTNAANALRQIHRRYSSPNAKAQP